MSVRKHRRNAFPWPLSLLMGRQCKIAWVVVGGPMAEALFRSHVETLLAATP